MTRLLPFVAVLLLVGCASTKPQMGTISDLSRVEGEAPFCEHKVPEQVCTRHHPELIPKFKAVNDWCPEHGVPESQCFECHPNLTFKAVPKLKPDADVKLLSSKGEDVGDLAALVVPGKVTIFDFYADWCAGCREIDVHANQVLNSRDDVAVRKLNVVDWDTPVAKRHLSGISGLPYVVVYGKSGQLVKSIQGVELGALDKAINEGANK